MYTLNAHAGGLRTWYWGFLPFCLKSLPFDTAELLTWSQLRDWQARITVQASAASTSSDGLLVAAAGDGGGPNVSQSSDSSSGSRSNGSDSSGSSSSRSSVSSSPERWLADNVPEQAWDAILGGCAGAAAVLASMPADCVKTYTDTRGAAVPEHARLMGGGAGGVRASFAAFMATGREMVARNGVGSLFNGLLPRLSDKVRTADEWFVVKQHAAEKLQLRGVQR